MPSVHRQNKSDDKTDLRWWRHDYTANSLEKGHRDDIYEGKWRWLLQRAEFMGTSPPPYLHLPLLANHFLLWRTLPLQLFLSFLKVSRWYSSQFAADPPFVSSWSVLFLLRPSASLPSFSVSQRGSGTQGHQGGGVMRTRVWWKNNSVKYPERIFQGFRGF